MLPRPGRTAGRRGRQSDPGRVRRERRLAPRADHRRFDWRKSTTRRFESWSSRKRREGYDLLGKANSYLESHELTAELERRMGSPAEIILEEATRWDARILAMGAFGHGRISQLFGSRGGHRILSVDRVALLCGPQVAA
ncbi:MAG: universal stress protein [Candidatus Eisenbacteria bacterium]